MPKRGKKYKEVSKLVDRTKMYSIEDAIQLV
ncbi:MAG TPA: 50S ribosomal protein L1, partial [Defluviitoga tunisiensis]|nr:50S ribosomal protein L1 [Defluviitoga tunisiensis]